MVIVKMANIIGVDLGGTSIKAGLVSPSGKMIKKCEIPTEARKGTKIVIDNIISSINNVKAGKIRGIGIGSPGPMDYKKGVIINPINLPFRNLPLRSIIQNKFKTKTYLDNDANCFALAEAIFGSGKKYENIVGPKDTWETIQFYKMKPSAESEDGYSGRIGIHEVLPVTQTIRNLVMSGGTADAIEAQAKKEGMMTMIEDGIFKAVQGVTTIEEVLRVVSE